MVNTLILKKFQTENTVEIQEGYGFLKTLIILVIIGAILYYTIIKEWLERACQSDYQIYEDSNYFAFNKKLIESRLLNAGDDFERI